MRIVCVAQLVRCVSTQRHVAPPGEGGYGAASLTWTTTSGSSSLSRGTSGAQRRCTAGSSSSAQEYNSDVELHTGSGSGSAADAHGAHDRKPRARSVCEREVCARVQSV